MLGVGSWVDGSWVDGGCWELGCWELGTGVGQVRWGFGGQQVHFGWVDTVDGGEIHFAPLKKPWNDSIPQLKYQQAMVSTMVSTWCRISFIHSIYTGIVFLVSIFGLWSVIFGGVAATGKVCCSRAKDWTDYAKSVRVLVLFEAWYLFSGWFKGSGNYRFWGLQAILHVGVEQP